MLFCTVIYCVFVQDVELKVSEIVYDLVGQPSYMGRYFNVSLLTYIRKCIKLVLYEYTNISCPLTILQHHT